MPFDAKIIFGAVIDEKLKDQIKITVVATGFDNRSQNKKAEVVKPAYTPNSFIAEKETEKEDLAREERNKNKFSSVFKNLPIKPAVENRKADQSLINDDEDDLSVPAFIRKKMG